ncbi:MAG TPA: hypothetical protein VHS55_08460 [Solirubrobacteraceae bacterium]|nr:hypothetical protein [Solirubrobacteraceae bacterium]
MPQCGQVTLVETGAMHCRELWLTGSALTISKRVFAGRLAGEITRFVLELRAETCLAASIKDYIIPPRREF